MRKTGMSLLQSFTDGAVLLAPHHVQNLRTLALEAPNEGFLATIAKGLGLSAERGKEDVAVAQDQLCAAFGVGSSERGKRFAFANGVAFIPMHGTLLHRDNWSDSRSTGYDYIRSHYNAAMEDPDVQGIVFDVDSGGGHVNGNFELADAIYANRGKKPTMALVDASCYSGAYSLSSAMDRIVATPSAGVGSIGVLSMHASLEGLLEKNGVEMTLIHSGAHKVDGNPFNNLPADVRARKQASCDKSYEKFVSLVARNRGIDAATVRGTEAACFDADEALSLGLIDAIQTPYEAMAAFFQELDGSVTNPQQGATNMSNTATAPGTDTAAVAAPTAAPTDEKARIKAITTSDAAKGREALANHFAFDTDMSADAACAALALAPVAAQTTTTTTTTSPFATAMDSTANPDVGATGGVGAEEAPKMSVGDRMASNYAAVTGAKLRD